MTQRVGERSREGTQQTISRAAHVERHAYSLLVLVINARRIRCLRPAANLVFIVDLVKLLKRQREAKSDGNLLLQHLRSHLGAHSRHFAFVQQAWLDGRLIAILDGWDECDRECKDEMQRYISCVLVGRISIVITSRPAAVDGDAAE